MTLDRRSRHVPRAVRYQGADFKEEGSDEFPSPQQRCFACAVMRAALLRPDFRSLKAILRDGSNFVAGALLPVLIATLGFWRASSFGTALSWSNNAWLSLFSFDRIAEEPTQRVGDPEVHSFPWSARRSVVRWFARSFCVCFEKSV